MPDGNSPDWFLRKHAEGEVFGPVPFDQIRAWVDSALVNPQDSVSGDGVHWTKAPMVAELRMDWLVDLDGQPLYGPTSPGALLEFHRMGEIDAMTPLINCCTGETHLFQDTPFFPNPREAAVSTRVSLQQRIMELEERLLEKSNALAFANQSIARLERRVFELEAALRAARGL
jgi:hypothetical protein